MAYFDDMSEALKIYPVDNVVIEIINVTLDGDAINVNEEGTFQVRVTNNGPLELTDVTLKISGQNGVKVRNSAAQSVFVPQFITGDEQCPIVAAHGGTAVVEGSRFSFEAPGNAQASKTLIKATLEGWNANLNHIFNDHTDRLPIAPKGTFTAAVIAA